MSINRVAISGNLTRDPELRQTGSGTSVMTFGVAVNDRRRNPQTNEWEDYPNFVDCVMFGTRAESIHRFLAKGTKVVVDGKLRYSSWERDGQRRSKLEVIVDDLDFVANRGNGGGQGSYAASAPQQSYQPQQGYASQVPQQNYAATAPVQVPQQTVQPAAAPVVQSPQMDVYDDEIPF